MGLLAISLFFIIPHIGISLEILQKVTAQDNELKFTFVRKWGTNGTGPNHFDRPHDVDFDSKGNVYVSDRELTISRNFRMMENSLKCGVQKDLMMDSSGYHTVLV